MQRAVALALLSSGNTILQNPSFCNDALSAIDMAKKLGAEIKEKNEELYIKGTEKVIDNQLKAGEAGLGIRMFVPVAALFSEQINFTGEGSLNKRPLHISEAEMEKLSVQLNTNSGYLPLSIQGPMRGGEIELDGSQSSQFLTGLLIALPLVNENSIIKVNNLKSKPYIDMTLEVMKHFGVELEHEGYEHFLITGNQQYACDSYYVEGDWSGTAFHLVGAAIGGEATINNINFSSKQADMAILEVLRKVGAEMEINDNSITVRKKKLKPFYFDATDCPDLFPPLSNLAAACNGVSVIRGVSRLLHKESNRALVLQEEWKKLGVAIDLDGDKMYIHGGNRVSGRIYSNNDHRIAMMGAIAALIADGPIEIEGTEAVNKSYPDFFGDFEQLSFPITNEL